MLLAGPLAISNVFKFFEYVFEVFFLNYYLCPGVHQGNTEEYLCITGR